MTTDETTKLRADGQMEEMDELRREHRLSYDDCPCPECQWGEPAFEDD